MKIAEKVDEVFEDPSKISKKVSFVIDSFLFVILSFHFFHFLPPSPSHSHSLFSYRL